MAKQRDDGVMEKRRMKVAKRFERGKGASEVARILKVRRQSAHERLDRRRQWHRRCVQGEFLFVRQVRRERLNGPEVTSNSIPTKPLASSAACCGMM